AVRRVAGGAGRAAGGLRPQPQRPGGARGAAASRPCRAGGSAGARPGRAGVALPAPANRPGRGGRTMSLSLSAGNPGLGNLLEEFAARLQAGEAVDAEAFAAAHPEHAELLQRLLPTMGVLAGLGGSAARSRLAGVGVEGPRGTLGDFRIVREVGRGGVGIVYE